MCLRPTFLFSTLVLATLSPAQRFVVFGTPLPAAVTVPGVQGSLALQPTALLPFPSGPSVGGTLEDLRGDQPQRFQGPLWYQELTAKGFSPLRRFPEISTGRDDAPDQPPGPANEVNQPLAPTIELTLARVPAKATFTCYLSFRDHLNHWSSLEAEFTRSGNTMKWIATRYPAGLGRLTTLTDTGNRIFWDRIGLLKTDADLTLELTKVKIVMRYEGLASGCLGTIPVVDRAVQATLGPGLFGLALLTLDGEALLTRKSWAGVTEDMPWCVQIAAEDFGKSGSDGVGDPFGNNPKYGNRVDLLCSEFVSWYYHQAGYVIGGQDFRDITATEQLDDTFRDAGRLYYYHLGRQQWLHMDTGVAYTPRAGDFLERRGADGAEHSMMMLRWDNVRKEATVINGPWPVTLRTVKVDELEQNGKDFRVGRIKVP